jgi:hypothetical protein
VIRLDSVIPSLLASSVERVLSAPRRFVLENRLDIEIIWMQLSVHNDEVARESKGVDLEVVMTRRLSIEYGLLSGEIDWAGADSSRISNIHPKISSKGEQCHFLGD